MKIFIIGGKAKSGKNTFGELLRDNLKEYGYKRIKNWELR